MRSCRLVIVACVRKAQTACICLRWCVVGVFPNAAMVMPDMTDTVSPSFARLLRLGRTEKRLLQMCADSVLVIVCFGAAMALRLESFAFLGNSSVWLMALICVPATILMFLAFGLYRSILRFISGQVLRAIGCGVIFSAAFLFLLAALQLLPATSRHNSAATMPVEEHHSLKVITKQHFICAEKAHAMATLHVES